LFIAADKGQCDLLSGEMLRDLKPAGHLHSVVAFQRVTLGQLGCLFDKRLGDLPEVVDANSSLNSS
jgi:hypothetical protein